MAYAGAEFADSVMAALSGDKGEPARPLATFSLFFSVWEGENVPRRGGRGGGRWRSLPMHRSSVQSFRAGGLGGRGRRHGVHVRGVQDHRRSILLLPG